MMYKSMKVIKLLWKIHYTSGKNIHVPYVAEVCVKKNRLFIIYVLKKKQVRYVNSFVYQKDVTTTTTTTKLR